MSNFDNLLDDLKAVTDEVGKKAGETLEISKLSLERARIRGRIQQNYRRLGEVIYGGYKNGEDVSDVVAVLYEQLDEDFERVEEIYNTICAIKAGADVVMDEDFSGGEEPKGEVVAELYAQEEAPKAEEAPNAPEAEEPAELPEEQAARRAAFAGKAQKSNENGIDVDAD